MAALGAFLQYIVLFIVFIAIAGLGIFTGNRLRKSRDAKKQKDTTANK